MNKFLFHFAIFFLLGQIRGKTCPNGKDSCPSWSTCCQMQDSLRYGCCPYKNAQCCPDKIHCCPAGSSCNSKTRSCDNVHQNVSLKWMVKIYERRLVGGLGVDLQDVSSNMGQTSMGEITAKDNDCPDGNTCPSKSTCCQMPQGNYGCCPYKNANCCTDKEHCCPNGFVCDVKKHRCLKNMKSRNFSIENIFGQLNEVPIFNLLKKEFEENQRAQQFSEGDVSLVICPDKIDMCPTRSTCCKMGSGRFGCCPYPQAMCCSDLKTCCPHGFNCVPGGCRLSSPIDAPITQNTNLFVN